MHKIFQEYTDGRTGQEATIPLFYSFGNSELPKTNKTLLEILFDRILNGIGQESQEKTIFVLNDMSLRGPSSLRSVKSDNVQISYHQVYFRGWAEFSRYCGFGNLTVQGTITHMWAKGEEFIDSIAQKLCSQEHFAEESLMLEYKGTTSIWTRYQTVDNPTRTYRVSMKTTELPKAQILWNTLFPQEKKQAMELEFSLSDPETVARFIPELYREYAH